MLEFDLHRTWYELPMAVVDIETTGLDVCTARIVEICILTRSGGTVADRWTQLVNPGCHVPMAAAAMHGINNAAVEDKPGLGELGQEICQRLEGRVMLAFYGLRFVRPILEAELNRVDVTLTTLPVLDPMVWAHARLPADHGAPQGLGVLCQSMGIKVPPDHGVLQDSEALLQLAHRLAPLVPDQLGELLDAQARWASDLDQWMDDRRREHGQ